MKQAFAAGALVGAILMAASAGHAGTITVNCATNGAGALASAVAGASGDTLSVTGPCNGGFYIGTNMNYGTIQSATAGTKATVNGPIGIAGAIYLTLNGLALKGGGPTNGVPAGLFLSPNSDVTLTNSSVTGFSGGYGAVSVVGASYLEITSSTVTNNKAAAGIAAAQGGSVQLGFFDADGNLCCGNTISGNTGPGVEVLSNANVSSWLTTYKSNTGPQIEAFTNASVDSRGDTITAGTATGVFVASGAKATMQPSGTLASGTLTGGTVTSSGIAVEAAAHGAVFLRDVTIKATGTAPAVYGVNQAQVELQGANKITASGGGLALELVLSGLLDQFDGASVGWTAAADTISGPIAASAGSTFNFSDATVTGAATITSAGLGLGDSKGAETVTINGNVTLSQGSGGGTPPTAARGKTKITGNLACTDVNNSSHFAAALVTVSGTNTCTAF